MSDTHSAARSEATMLAPNRPPAGDSGSITTGPEIVVPSSFGGQERGVGTEPLARIEDKTSRIEEKLARSEAAMQRVVDRFELASARMNEVATQGELAAVRGDVSFIAGRVRRVPGWTALLGSSLVTAVLTAVAVVLVLRYLPGGLPR
jgi:hypothetical protein